MTILTLINKALLRLWVLILSPVIFLMAIIGLLAVKLFKALLMPRKHS